MLIKRKLHVHIERTDSDTVHNFSLPAGFLNVAMYTGLFIIIAMLAGLGFHIHNLNQLGLYKKLNAEYTAYSAQLDELSQQAGDARHKLDIMMAWEDGIRQQNNLSAIDADIRKVGTGGMPIVTRDVYTNDLQKNAYFNEVQKDIQQLRRISAYNRETHQKAADNIRLRDDIFRHTPTIYPTFGRITTRFGYRTHPITKRRDYHKGLDIANDTGTPIYATADGTVKKVVRKKLIGKMIEIEHAYGYKTVYGHLDEYLVKVGDKVTKGQIIGLMGNTGRSTGPHLHYEIVYYGKALNPVKYLNRPKDKIKIKNS